MNSLQFTDGTLELSIIIQLKNNQDLTRNELIRLEAHNICCRPNDFQVHCDVAILALLHPTISTTHKDPALIWANVQTRCVDFRCHLSGFLRSHTQTRQFSKSEPGHRWLSTQLKLVRSLATIADTNCRLTSPFSRQLQVPNYGVLGTNCCWAIRTEQSDDDDQPGDSHVTCYSG